MGSGVDFLEHTDGYVSVDFCGVQPYVAEHRLNITDVSATFEHQRSHRVPEDVARTILADSCCPHIPPAGGAR